MAEQFYTILTQIGKAKIANASALGQKIEFDNFALGDGGGSYYNPIESQTELENEVWRGAIGNVTIDEDNPNWIVIENIIPASIGGFMIREAGVFDNEGNLIAIGKYPETYKPVVADGSAKDLYIKMILEVSNTAVVTIKIDPTIILATKKDIDILGNRIGTNETEIVDLKTRLGAHEADYTYQTPTIVGTQIRIRQGSNSNRLYFKLDNDLIGNITISTDNGSTSNPLRDIYGFNVEELEKGFYEVIAEANFFTLVPKGGKKIDDVDYTITSQNGEYLIPKGQHSGDGVVKAQFANLTSGNVKQGVNIGGVVGEYPLSENLELYRILCGTISSSPPLDMTWGDHPSYTTKEYSINIPTDTIGVFLTDGSHRMNFKQKEIAYLKNGIWEGSIKLDNPAGGAVDQYIIKGEWNVSTSKLKITVANTGSQKALFYIGVYCLK